MTGSGDGPSAPKPPPAIAVLAVKVKPLRGRFANLDGCARRWRLVCKSPC
jgi:hypothetical protein